MDLEVEVSGKEGGSGRPASCAGSQFVEDARTVVRREINGQDPELYSSRVAHCGSDATTWHECHCAEHLEAGRN
jgi:hypothetical protein